MKKMKQPIWIKILVILILITLGYISDKSSKLLATIYLKDHPPVEIVKDYLHLTYTENSSGVFSILDGIKEEIRLPILYTLFSMTFIIVGFMLGYAVVKKSVLLSISFSFILGGGLGNFLDLVFDGHVVDFIDMHYFHKFHWPTYNVADILIVVGMILIVIGNFILFKSQIQNSKTYSRLHTGAILLFENKHNLLQRK